MIVVIVWFFKILCDFFVVVILGFPQDKRKIWVRAKSKNGEEDEEGELKSHANIAGGDQWDYGDYAESLELGDFDEFLGVQ